MDGKEDDKERFVKLLLSFSNGMAECYPENHEISSTSQKMQVLVQTAWGVDKIIEHWYKYLMSPLPSSTRYANPLQRLLGTKAVMYHAYIYNDIQTAAKHQNPMKPYIDLEYVLSDPSFDDESREATIKYMQALNECVFACLNVDPPAAPSRENIAAEIKRHNDNNSTTQKLACVESAPSAGGVGKLSNTANDLILHIADLATGHGVKVDEALLNEIRDGGGADDWIMSLDAEMQNVIEPHQESLYNLFVAHRYVDFSDSICEGSILDRIGLKAATSAAAAPPPEAMVEKIMQLNVLTQVNKSVPAAMRNRIESVAQNLAGQILSGNMSLSGIDLNEIGQEVLDGCDPDDLTDLANQVGALLPELSNIAAANGGGVDIGSILALANQQ